jgi:hypothetical protein
MNEPYCWPPDVIDRLTVMDICCLNAPLSPEKAARPGFRSLAAARAHVAAVRAADPWGHG